MIKAITFDFWDTLVIDDSDEPKRAAQGLSSKAETRRQLLAAEIGRYHPEIGPERAAEAFAWANEQFNYCWKTLHYTPTVAARLSLAYTRLGIDLTPGFAELVTAVEQMEVAISPDFLPGVAETLAALAQNYTLGIVSDAIHTPGRGLRRILERAGLLDYFTYCVFSDEGGAAKPHPRVSEMAAAKLDTSLDQIVHVGDRESNDVAGPLALGMKAILFTGAVDRGSEGTQAAAVCHNFADLPKIIAEIGS
ncbi:MAG TPA: HAD family hydrolase [Anaerolineae bacterium]|nr:HAD family hydrolase [Anaerolineae bacterium]